MNPNTSNSPILASPSANLSSAEPVIPSPKAPRGGISNFISLAFILFLAFFIAFLITHFVFQSYQVSGPSMQPTLLNNDRLIVFKAPRTWARITGHPYIPDRGDIIVFSQSNLPGLDSLGPKDLVKRVIGLPGDHLVINNDVITIYNKQNPNGFNPDTTLAYGKNIQPTSGNVDITLPAGEIYVCGDNRAVSEDSRFFGPISADKIIGKLVLRVLPINRATKF